MHQYKTLNELPKDRVVDKAVALGVILQNRDGEEIYVDLLIQDDSFSAVVRAIRKHFDRSWTIFESWEIEPDNAIAMAA